MPSFPKTAGKNRQCNWYANNADKNSPDLCVHLHALHTDLPPSLPDSRAATHPPWLWIESFLSIHTTALGGFGSASEAATRNHKMRQTWRRFPLRKLRGTNVLHQGTATFSWTWLQLHGYSVIQKAKIVYVHSCGSLHFPKNKQTGEVTAVLNPSSNTKHTKSRK